MQTYEKSSSLALFLCCFSLGISRRWWVVKLPPEDQWRPR